MNKSRLVSARPWLNTITRSTLRDDFLAGLTNALVVFPQGVAFATIAGLPPEYGLYTALITPVIAALMGASWIMISGPTTAISAILLSTLVPHAEPGTVPYIELALTMTILVGGLQLIAGMARLGALISFISHSVIIGFTAAAALIIAASQLPTAFGLAAGYGGDIVDRVIYLFSAIEQINMLAIALSIGAFGTIAVCRQLDKRIPGFLIALIAAGICGYFIQEWGLGIDMFEPLPSIVPSLHLPQTDFNTYIDLIPGAATIAFVALLEAISIGRAFSVRRQEPFESNREIMGQGLSNFIGGFFSCYAGSGSFTRSALNAEAGAKTPLSAVFSAIVLLVLLALLARYVRYVPQPAMAGIIIYVAWRLISFDEITHISTCSNSDTFILAATFLAGILISLEAAIVVGVISSLFVFLGKSAKPLVAVVTPARYQGRRSFRGVIRYDLQQCPQIAVYRIEGPLYFASVEYVEQKIRSHEVHYGARKFSVYHLRGVGTIDLAGADFIIDEMRRAREKGGELSLIATRNEVLLTLQKTQVLDALGEENLYIGKAEAIARTVEQVDDAICATCKIRTFFECAKKSAPEGFEDYVSEQTIPSPHMPVRK